MTRWLPYPLLWLALTALWLLLNQSVWIGHVLLGGALSYVACQAFARLQPPRSAPAGGGGTEAGGRSPWPRRLRAIAILIGAVAVDVVRSNIGVARIVIGGRPPGRTCAFVDIPLALRDPYGLAVLACIITATPGTAWTRYDAGRGVLTMHILDLVDEATWIAIIKGRYERLLLEVFG